jgi:CelD/BcsL family acetyltransferase involved in cellulose biosynthesis
MVSPQHEFIEKIQSGGQDVLAIKHTPSPLHVASAPMTAHVQTGRDLHCETLKDASAVRAVRDELTRIVERPGAASGIVQHPDWLLCELECRGTTVSPHVVVARDEAGRIVGYAPFLAERHIGRVAFGSQPIPVYRGHALRMLGSVAVAATETRREVEIAIAAALRSDPGVRVLRIQETLLPNTFAAALAEGPRGFARIASNLLDQTNWTILPQTSLADYLANLGSKRRNDLERRLRKVYKKLGDQACLRIFDAPEHIDDYCKLMNEVYARSWHATAQPIDWELLPRRTLLRSFAGEDHFIGHMLMLGPRPIAYVHGYRLGGHYLLDDTGYDEEFAALGVGSALVFDAIQNLLGHHPAELIDFGYGDNQYKRVLADRQTPCGSLYIIRGIIPRACFGLIVPLRWAYRCLRGIRARIRKPAQAPSANAR